VRKLFACLVFFASATFAQDQSEPVVGPPQVAWKDMTKQQKGKYMKMVVVPTMAPLFTAFNPKEFAKVECWTCHGEDAQDREFKMPNPKLAVLPSTPEGFKKVAKEKPDWVKFMSGTVKPQMAKLLGLPEFDPKHPKKPGFGCSNCHTLK
jgi:hypothetical protein